MHLKEISIEGFKSYAKRVNLLEFDSHFNAITGLNGSGKSNILDAICFVLGISNLSQIRVSNLQDLIYKKGQAGIREASVSITFDNSDKSRSPPEYMEENEIIITRQINGSRSKYKLNRNIVKQNQVHDLFRSVQLNINNPHFLIMQGQITKVLNMKPSEILLMLQEAVGTAMFEDKKEKAFKIFNEKETKLKEIDIIFNTVINKSLDKLRIQKSEYDKYLAAEKKKNKLNKYCIAYEYMQIDEKLKNEIEKCEFAKNKLEEVQNKNKEILIENDHKNAEMNKIVTQNFNTEEKEIFELKNKLDEIMKSMTNEESKLEHKNENLKQEENEKIDIKNNFKELSDVSFVSAIEKNEHILSELEEEHGRLEENVKRKENEFKISKVANNEEKTKILRNKLEESLINQNSTKNSILQYENKIKELEEQRKEYEQKYTIEKTKSESTEKELEEIKEEIKRIEEVIKCNIDDERYDALEEEKREKIERYEKIDEMYKNNNRRIEEIRIKYKNPCENFNRRRIKGIVADLIKINDKEYILPLDVAAGGKLRQLVIDSHVTGKLLLEKKVFNNVVTLIPLDVVRGQIISEYKKRLARNLVGNNAIPAIELIEYDYEIKAALEYVFGNIFICKDELTAKTLAFHPEIKIRCITMEGDDYNPNGFLTGGSRNINNCTLKWYDDMEKSKIELEEVQNEIEIFNREWDVIQNRLNKIKELESHLENKKEEMRFIKEKLQRNKAQEFYDELKENEMNINIERNKINEYNLKLEEFKSEENEIRRLLISTENHEMFIKNSEDVYKKAKEELKENNENIKAKEMEIATLKVRKEEAKRIREENLNKLEELNISTKNIKFEIERIKETMKEMEKMKENTENNLKEYERKLCEGNEILRNLESQIYKNLEDISNNNMEQINLKNKISEYNTNRKEMIKKIEDIIKDNPWIENEYHEFGKANGEYDWTTKDVNEAKKEYEASIAIVKNYSNRINPKADMEFEIKINEYNQLFSKRKKIEKDKENLQKVIEDLDEKKNDAIKDIWMKVNENIGQIFSSLLPETDAKLEPPDGVSYLEGLEVKVCLGGQWKRSLLELSGGQKSLLALSLILSLLRFRPAPLYILDEIDSALDLSHTQNIGQMIKEFFPESQFIIVSLKEDLFKHANVVYKTTFEDGVSKISINVPDV